MIVITEEISVNKPWIESELRISSFVSSSKNRFVMEWLLCFPPSPVSYVKKR